MLPRGNMTLYFKCLYYDQREALYQRHCRIIASGKDRDVLELSRMIADRIEGTPSLEESALVHGPANDSPALPFHRVGPTDSLSVLGVG